MRKLQNRKSAPCALVLLAAITAIIIFGSSAMHAQSAARQIAIPLPPMGWSSWNSFSNTIDSQIIDGPGQSHDLLRHVEGGLSIHQHRRGLVAG